MAATTLRAALAWRSGLFVSLLAGLCTQALAADCWAPARHQVSAGPGHATLAQGMARAESLLQRDAALNALPGVRLQAKGFIGGPAQGQPLPAMELRAAVHRPAVWGPGCSLQQARADYASPAQVAVHFNTLEPVLRLLAAPQAASDSGWFAAPSLSTSERGERLYGRRVLLLAPPGLAPLLPLSADEYLADWERRLAEMALHAPGSSAARELAGLRQHRAGLSTAQRQAPAVLGAMHDGSPPWALAAAGAEHSTPLLRINPALWHGAAPGAVRLVVLEVWLNNEGDELTDALQAWLAGVDTRPYAALLRP